MNDLAPMYQRLELARRLQCYLQSLIHREAGNGEGLLRLSEFAGNLAWTTHGGTFALPGAERALMALPGITGYRVSNLDLGALEGRTLHVLTEAYAVGGHTRLARRWIEVMEKDRHAVVLTRQRGSLDPAWLVPEGREVPMVDLEQAGMSSRCERVAALVACFKVASRVVLHIHPDDAYSVAAAHLAPEVDIRFLNHADHVAWLGAALPVTMLNLREGGTKLAVRRRGIVEGACDVIPLPITQPPRIDRLEARANLGILEHEVMLLTIASGYKFTPVGGRSLVDVLGPCLKRPEVQIVAIGPEADHPVFAELASSYPGRVKTLGVIPDPDIYRAAADIYVDSYPFCSPTSMLESAVLGTPIVAFQPDIEEFGILYTECPGLPRSSYSAQDPERFHALVDDVVTRPAARQEMAEALSRGMLQHLPEGWKNSLSRHLERKLGQSGWRAEGVPVLQGGLDAVLAGLGRDPREFPRLSRWAGLGKWSRLVVMAERARSFLN